MIYFVTAARDEIYFTTSLPEKADWMTQGILVDEGRSRRDARGLRELPFRRAEACSRRRREVHKWGIYERDPLPTWSKGNVVLLGDACHPMTPYMASGAAMALEDAAVLARAIDEADTLEAAFRLYEADPQAARQRGAGRLQRQHLDAQRDQSGLALRLRRLARAVALQARGRRLDLLRIVMTPGA